MISGTQLLEIKERLLTAAEAARNLVDSNQEMVRYDEEQYWRVQLAFVSLRGDVLSLFSELDTLRAMFADRVDEFLMKGGLSDAISSDAGSAGNSGDDVPAVEDRGSGSGSEEKRDDPAAASEPVPAKRTRRKRAKRAKSSGDSPDSEVATESMDGGAG